MTLPPTGPATDPGTVPAPPAPGRLGQPLDPDEAGRYLAELDAWCRSRRTELAVLDGAALAAQRPDPASIDDLMLSLALWKAVADRSALLSATWDGGRVGPVERERLAALVWGRLDALERQGAPGGGSGLSLSLPEACRLSDSLVAALRVRLGLDLSGAEVTARTRALRAQLERIRDQVAGEPPGTGQQKAAARSGRLARRLAELADRAGRGGDVEGLLGPLEIEAATFERDLIVGSARRRQAGRLVARARKQRAELEARESALRELVGTCVAEVEPAPRYAVPDVSVLGPVPNTPAALEHYLSRLDQVARAMEVVQTAYGQALAVRSELAGRLAALSVKATALGVAQHPDLERSRSMALETLDRRPCPVVIAEQLVGLYASYLTAAAAPAAAPAAAATATEPAPPPPVADAQEVRP